MARGDVAPPVYRRRHPSGPLGARTRGRESERGVTARRYDDDTYRTAIQDPAVRTMADLCRRLGLVPRGANYETVRLFGRRLGIEVDHVLAWRRLGCADEALREAAENATSVNEVLRSLELPCTGENRIAATPDAGPVATHRGAPPGTQEAAQRRSVQTPHLHRPPAAHSSPRPIHRQLWRPLRSTRPDVGGQDPWEAAATCREARTCDTDVLVAARSAPRAAALPRGGLPGCSRCVAHPGGRDHRDGRRTHIACLSGRVQDPRDVRHRSQPPPARRHPWETPPPAP